MSEPVSIPFNRQAGQGIYVFWIVEPLDLSVLVWLLTLNLAFLESYWLFLWTIFFFVLYLALLRAGRPPGYDKHLLGAILAPKYLRPGRSDSKSVIREPNQSHE